MMYSVIGILAIIILVIINHDVFWGRDEDVVPAQRAYRNFLFGVLAYYITDALWGILDSFHAVNALIVDTSIYFVVMTASVLLWTHYVTDYLEHDGSFKPVLLNAGRFMLAFGVIIVVVNLFTPALFWFDADGTYHAGTARYVVFALQVAMFFLTAVYTLTVMARLEGSERRRHWAISLFGLAMVVLIAVQVFFPLLPLYSMGYMIGTCLLHTFVVEDEKDEYRSKVEETLERVQQRELELGSARQLAYTDPLTSVKSKHAYTEAESKMNLRIANGTVKEFAMVVFDLNDLKHINDTRGHESGDSYIISACKLICDSYKHSPVFRIGGDEFVAVLEGDDFLNREDLLATFNWQVEQNQMNGETVVAAGMADFEPERDSACWTIFDRADANMYQRKNELKAMGAIAKEQA